MIRQRRRLTMEGINIVAALVFVLFSVRPSLLTSLSSLLLLPLTLRCCLATIYQRNKLLLFANRVKTRFEAYE